eukprot:Nk52_evm8s293 gene=Nk52_evmTU8s293
MTKGKKILQLERVIGISHPSPAAFASHEEKICYPAGSVVVVYNRRKDKQLLFMHSSHKAIISVVFSLDGEYLAGGESGHQPSILVWNKSGKLVSELSGHKYGVQAVCFSPNGKYLVSVGTKHDGNVILWNWKTGTKLSSHKVSCEVSSVCFSENGNWFVTVGLKHVKFWYLCGAGSPMKSGGDVILPGKPLESRAGILGTHRTNKFTDVCRGGKNTYAVTASGLLCMFGPSRILEKWIDLKMGKASAISVAAKYIACGGADGIIRLFDSSNLSYITTLPQPLPLAENAHDEQSETLPSVLAVELDFDCKYLYCVYSDHSIYVWNISNVDMIGKVKSFHSHSACVWDVVQIPRKSGSGESFGSHCDFATCSSDGTVRLWNSGENVMLKTIVTGDGPLSDGGAENNSEAVRCMAVNAAGMIACGDRAGNVKIYQGPDFERQIANIPAHDSEVLSLAFTPSAFSSEQLLASGSRDRLIHVFDIQRKFSLKQTIADHSGAITSLNFSQPPNQKLQLISSGSDKSIVFSSYSTNGQNSEGAFSLAHSVVGKTTVYDTSVDLTNKYLATVGQDKQLRIYSNASGKNIRSYKGDLKEDGGLLKVTLDPAGIFAACSGADKSIRVYDFYSGAQLTKISGHSEVVTGLAFTLDCKHLISVGADACIFVWKIGSDMVVAMNERLEELNMINQTLDIKANNAPELGVTVDMGERKSFSQMTPMVPELSGKVIDGADDNQQHFANQKSKLEALIPKTEIVEADNESSFMSFRVDKSLPGWAKRQQLSNDPQTPLRQEEQIQSKWAKRVNANEMVFFSEIDKDSKFYVKPGDFEDRRRFTIEPEGIALKGNEEEDITIESLDFENQRPMPPKETLGFIEDDSEVDEEEQDEEDKEEKIVYPPQKNLKATFHVSDSVHIKKADDETIASENEDEEDDNDMSDENDSDGGPVFSKFFAGESFVNKNFENFNSYSQNECRLSLTSKYLKQSISKDVNHDKENEDSSAQLTSSTNDALKLRQASLAMEVEKTRERLRKLGVQYGVSENEKSASNSDVSSSNGATVVLSETVANVRSSQTNDGTSREPSTDNIKLTPASDMPVYRSPSPEKLMASQMEEVPSPSTDKEMTSPVKCTSPPVSTTEPRTNESDDNELTSTVHVVQDSGSSKHNDGKEEAILTSFEALDALAAAHTLEKLCKVTIEKLSNLEDSSDSRHHPARQSLANVQQLTEQVIGPSLPKEPLAFEDSDRSTCNSPGLESIRSSMFGGSSISNRETGLLEKYSDMLMEIMKQKMDLTQTQAKL